MIDRIARLANVAIGRYLSEEPLKGYKAEYVKAGLPLIFREYMAVMVVLPFLILVLGLAAPLNDLGLQIFAGVLAAVLAFFIIYIYPLERVDSRRKKIDVELPLALNYTAAILGSGAPPLTAFRMVAQFAEYEELSKEAGKIVHDVEMLGMDLPSALAREADRTPSKQLREIYQSLRSEIVSGGNITSFFEEKAADRMAHYARQQQEYKQSSDTLANIYLVVALVAPLLFIVMIGIMDFVATSGAGKLLGTDLGAGFTADAMNMAVFFGIPLVNVIFVIIVKLTQPEVL
jgi:flagellar protein FlaJ